MLGMGYVLLSGSFACAIGASQQPPSSPWILSLQLGAVICFVLGIGLLVMAKRGRARNEAEPESTTIKRTRIGEMNAYVNSTADNVTEDSDIRKWRGHVKHRPKGKR